MLVRALIVHLLLLLLVQKRTNGLLLRINDYGLHQLANSTRQWLFRSIPLSRMAAFREDFARGGIGQGSLLLSNILMQQFLPPLIRFRPTDHGVIYMSTASGYAQASAEWAIDYRLLETITLPMKGQIVGEMGGLISEVGIRMGDGDGDDLKMMVISCQARIQELRTAFTGGIAADLLHIFRSLLHNTIRAQLQQAFCRTIESEWLPWITRTLRHFPTNVSISEQPRVVLIQRLSSVVVSEGNIDLRMKTDIEWDGELVETDPTLIENFAVEKMEKSNRMVDMYIHEHSVQSLVALAHIGGLFNRTVRSPFLRTQCDLLCVGSILPELRNTYPNTSLYVLAETIAPPLIELQSRKANVQVNASLEVFVDGENNSILSIRVELNFELTLEMYSKKLKGYLQMNTAHASVVDSQIGKLSQKTIDFLVNMASPFVEDWADSILGRGMTLGDPFQFPSYNEHLSIDTHCLRFQTDLVLPAFLR